MSPNRALFDTTTRSAGLTVRARWRMGVHHLGWAAHREREGVLGEGASDRDVCGNATAVLLPLIGMGIVPLVVWLAVTPPLPSTGIVLMAPPRIRQAISVGTSVSYRVPRRSRRP